MGNRKAYKAVKQKMMMIYKQRLANTRGAAETEWKNNV